jgi:hypothetical protein
MMNNGYPHKRINNNSTQRCAPTMDRARTLTQEQQPNNISTAEEQKSRTRTTDGLIPSTSFMICRWSSAS